MFKSVISAFFRPLTFRQMSADWLAAHEPTFSSSWHANCRHRLAHELAPLADRPATHLKRREIIQTLSTISSPNIANQAHTIVSAIYSWAIATGHLDIPHPARGLRKRPTTSRDRTLCEVELCAIWRASQSFGSYGRIVRLLLLTGQRRDEIGALQWTEINLERAEIVLPASRTKSRRAHVVPLSPLAVAQLPDRKVRRGGQVFGRLPGRGFTGWSKCKATLDEALVAGEAVPKAWRLHDLRRTYATMSAEFDLAPPHIIEAVLNHVGHQGGVAGIYNRSPYHRQKRAALDAWAAHVEGLVISAERIETGA